MIQLGVLGIELVSSFLAANRDHFRDYFLHGRISFIENVGGNFAVAIDAEDELREIVRVN